MIEINNVFYVNVNNYLENNSEYPILQPINTEHNVLEETKDD